MAVNQELMRFYSEGNALHLLLDAVAASTALYGLGAYASCRAP